MYNERGNLQDNPFEVLDVKGVGRLMALAVDWGRASRSQGWRQRTPRSRVRWRRTRRPERGARPRPRAR
jgi:hypothetical protein